MEHTLAQLKLLDCPATEDFDRLTRLAARMLSVPVTLVSVIDHDQDRQFFTSEKGLGEPWASLRQTPLSHSFCKHVVANGKPLVVEDAKNHQLVRDNPAIPDMNIAAYLGIPVTAPDGAVLGTLCAIDFKPRAWSQDDISSLTDLAGSVTTQIKLQATQNAREDTQKAATQLGRAVENSHHEVFMFESGSFHFTTVNKGARENLGYSMAELRTLTPANIKPDFSLDDLNALVEPLKKRSLPNLEFETKHQRKDGTIYPVSIRLELHDDSDMFIAFVEDITERRKLERALEKETESFLSFFKYAPEPMSVSAMDTTVLQANAACEHLFGIPPAELMGTKFFTFIPEERRAEVQAGFENTTPENPFYSVLLEQEMSGVPKIVIWSNVVQFEDGEPTKIFSIANDVTELYAAKTRAENSANEAEKAMEVRKIFLANMSHEVRTPLNAIMGLFQLIQMADVPPRQKKQAEVGLDASHHLLAQLVNVLEMSRVEADAVEIDPASTDIRSLARQWLETAAATKHRLGKSIELSLEVDEAMPLFAVLDERRVTQIVNNMTDNALKFTKEGRVTIQIGHLENTDPSAPPQLQISVSDTGCGIPENQHEAIFERFVQIDDAQTRENGGSGLGLAISRELATLMGGTLNITCPSTDDCYTTTFSLRL
ncbi:MAG: ATP-binding protein [Sulfitobacter sp.]